MENFITETTDKISPGCLLPAEKNNSWHPSIFFLSFLSLHIYIHIMCTVIYIYHIYYIQSVISYLSINIVFPHSSAGKESTCNAGDLGLIPGLGRYPGGGKGYPL